MSTGRQRSGKRKAGDSGRLAVHLDFGDGDVEDVEVDVATFTYGELHKVRVALASLTVVDDKGRVSVEPSLDERVLVHAWVTLCRRREIDWEDFFARLPRRGFAVAAAGDGGDADDPEG